MMASALKKNQQKSNSRKSQTLINSPIVKRIHNRPVALQGWLMKRGSDGLMLWKKRWFVLSDYCLFYYKDTFEEKLLGSLILASYEISPCSPDDKGYKKFSFKAEHANMRTYYFAAENQALMEQWIKALTLASLLEENISFEKLGEDSKTYLESNKQSGDFLSSPHDMGVMNSQKSSDPQPVYVNAPPKPKRLNESSSPECPLDMHFKEDSFQNYQNQPYNVVYNSPSPAQQFSMTPARQSYTMNYDQRCADSYGRTNITPPVENQINQSNFQDRHTSPFNITKDNSHSPKNVSFSFPPRPRSVDFLDYSAKASSNMVDPECADKIKLNCRPKSSLSTVNANEGEAIHWSAEEYARKMRQSSMYVKPKARHNISGNTSNSSQTSNCTAEKQIFKNDLGNKSERVPSVHYRTHMSTDKHFSRSASARLFRPMSDLKDDCDIDNMCSGISMQPDSAPNKDSSSKVQQREESMKRLLEWKQRMLQSPLTRKPHGNNMFMPERLCSYTMHNKTDTYQCGSISSCGSRTENTRLDGCEPKYGNPMTLVENDSTQKEGRKIHGDNNGNILNESKLSNHKPEHLEPLRNIRVPDGYEYSDEKPYSNLKLDYSIVNKGELSPNVNCSYDDETLKNKSVNLQDFNKKVEKKSTPLQPIANEKDEEWGVKLDESRVIKEFSYHYITTDKYDECHTKKEVDSFMHSNFNNKKKHSSQDIIGYQSSKMNSRKGNQLQPKNEFQNFSCNELSNHFDNKSNEKESDMLQKTCNRTHRKSNKGNIINKGQSLRIYRKDNNKSLPKDIVNKSIPVNESEKRLVQSDSEALLYDTSSDVEDKIVFHRDHMEKIDSSSDDERDEEVAAVLSKEKNFVSTVFQSVKSPYRNCPSTENLDCSSVLNDTSSIEIKILSNNEQNSCFQATHEKNLSTSTDVNSDNQEENYMPMTPRKKANTQIKNEAAHSRSNSALHTLIIDNLLGSSEESPYVEMTQNRSQESCQRINNSYQNPSSHKNECLYNLHTETPGYCEIDKGKDMQYEIIYNASISQEPLYMEVPSLKEKDDKSLFTLRNDNASDINYNKNNNSKGNMSQLKNSTRPSLPDILNTTTPSLNQGSGRSDSSDADDEASKDLDSLDAPRHPRFSLSDTFRPASYYLGASLGDRAIITLNTEHPDSSDSDLVSPPPIPTSSPPLDELETSIDSTIINKEASLSHLKMESSNTYSNELFLQTNVKDFIHPYKIKKTLRNSNSNLYEASSEESVNYEKREQRLKRRPLSADILSSLQEMNFIMPPSDVELKSNIQSGQTKYQNYIDDQDSAESDHLLHLKLHKYKNNKCRIFFHENRENMTSNETLDNDSGNEVKYKDNRFNQKQPIYSCSNATTSKKNEAKSCMKNQYENLRIDNESSDYKLLIDKYQSNTQQESYKEKSIYITENKSVISHPIEHQNNAPYYYSDLLKIDAKSFHDFDKNRWEEHISEDNDKVSTFLSNEKNTAKTSNYNQFNESDTFEHKSEISEKFKISSSPEINYEPTNISSNKFNPDSTDNEYPNKNEITPSNKNEFARRQAQPTPHRTRSLEGLIDSHPNNSLANNDILKAKSSLRLTKSQSQKVLLENKNFKDDAVNSENNNPENQDMWEEDTLWRENLRKVSVRHTRSLEDLDRKESSQDALSFSPKIPEDLNTTYENLNVAYTSDKNIEKYINEKQELISESVMATKFDMKNENDNIAGSSKTHDVSKTTEHEINHMNFGQRIIDPMREREGTGGTNSSFEIDREKLRQWDLMSSAPAMLSSNRAVIKPITERKTNFSSTNLAGSDVQKEETPGIQKELEKAEKSNPANINTGLIVAHDQDQGQAWNLKVSAGELLGRTHEELVLLLIQLRRQRATVCQSMEKCHREIEEKACLADLDKVNRLEHLQKLDELKAKLADLEKQYEKGKPLVNLVDNMVKLGSLYQAGSPQKLEFIQKIQEQRLLAEERRDWERIRPDHHELKAKVERLYRLDKLLQEESGTLHSLQQDKGVLERALGGLRNKLQGIHGNSPETEWYKRQQRLLERELSRVRSILALNSKKLEETVAENARLEQELVVLRQKLQLSRRTAEPGGANTAALEAELCRVQLLVGNLLRQRQELSLQVRQLTEKSNSLSRQIWPDHQAERCSYGRKQFTNGWIETDLDADVSNEIANVSACHNIRHQPVYVSPLYVNTTDRENVNECCNYQEEIFDESPMSARSPECRIPDSHDEDAFKQAYGLHLKEKPQEIKTVRIVKRESERRQRDRDRSGNIGIPITYASPKRPINDDRLSDKSKCERDLEDVMESDYRPNEPPPTPGPRTDSVNAVWNMVRKNKMKGKLICKSPLERSDSLPMQTDSPQLSPVYLSETARKIVEEVAWQGMGEKRLIPKEKRRHHTMSGPSLIAPQNLFSQMGSRDDLDIERVLRPRLTTPDVVRSTLIRVDPHYTKETIDNILGAPGKILIPERYIPESQPELTKEEQNKRSKKADAIRKMLCETAAVAPKDSDSEGLEKTSSLKRKVAEEKKNREHLLQLSQILAQQVMEKSKIVAVMAIASLPQNISQDEEEEEEEEYSSFESLPLYQQRDNFFS